MSFTSDPATGAPSLGRDELTIAVISDYQTFQDANFAEKYQDFLSRVGGVCPLLFSADRLFQGRSLYERRGDKLWFLVVFSGQTIVALLPLQLETFGVWPLSFKRLRLWGKIGCYNDVQSSDFISVAEHAEQAAEAVAIYLQRELGRSFDEIQLMRIRADSVFTREIETRLPTFEAAKTAEAVYMYSGKVKITERIKGETFRKIRKARERLVEDFAQVEYACITQITPELFDELAQLHITRQHALVEQGRQRFSFFEDPVERKVLYGQLCLAEQAGAIRLYTLRLDGELATYLLCIGRAGTTMALITAFKEIAAHRYQARCLWYYAFQQELENFDTQIINMGYGGHQLKETFSTDLMPLKTLSIRDRTHKISVFRYGILQAAKRVKDYLKKIKK